MKSRCCGGPVKRPFVRQGGGGSCVGFRLTESPVRLSQAFGSSRWDQLQRQQTLGKGKRGDWQVWRKTKAQDQGLPLTGALCRAGLKRSQHWGFYCVGDDWTANVNSGRQLLRCWCFREMLSKYYRLGEWPPQGRLSGESLHNAKITKQKTHPHAFLFASKSRMQKPRDVRRLFQGVSRTKPLLADSTYRDLAWL